MVISLSVLITCPIHRLVSHASGNIYRDSGDLSFVCSDVLYTTDGFHPTCLKIAHHTEEIHSGVLQTSVSDLEPVLLSVSLRSKNGHE